MTDGVIDKCNIRTATLVIHYDSAPTKKLFGKRMFCMATSYPSTEVMLIYTIKTRKPLTTVSLSHAFSLLGEGMFVADHRNGAQHSLRP